MKTIEGYLTKKDTFTKAVVCYLVEGDKVLLGLRKRVSFGLGENFVSGIGGKVGDQEELKNESDEDALKREVKEEVGVDVLNYVDRGSVIFIFPNKPKWNQFVQIYVVDRWSGIPIETEPIKPIWFDKNNLPVGQMWDDNRYWVPLILSGKSIEAVFIYGEDNKTVVDNWIEVKD